MSPLDLRPELDLIPGAGIGSPVTTCASFTLNGRRRTLRPAGVIGAARHTRSGARWAMGAGRSGVCCGVRSRPRPPTSTNPSRYCPPRWPTGATPCQHVQAAEPAGDGGARRGRPPAPASAGSPACPSRALQCGWHGSSSRRHGAFLGAAGPSRLRCSQTLLCLRRHPATLQTGIWNSCSRPAARAGPTGPCRGPGRSSGCPQGNSEARGAAPPADRPAVSTAGNAASVVFARKPNGSWHILLRLPGPQRHREALVPPLPLVDALLDEARGPAGSPSSISPRATPCELTGFFSSNRPDFSP